MTIVGLDTHGGSGSNVAPIDPGPVDTPVPPRYVAAIETNVDYERGFSGGTRWANVGLVGADCGSANHTSDFDEHIQMPLSEGPKSLPEVNSKPWMPLDNWWLVLHAIDNHRALIACHCTCKGFRAITQKIMDDYHALVCGVQPVYTSDFSNELCQRMREDPLVAWFTKTILVTSRQLPVFSIEFSERLHRIARLEISAYQENSPIILPMQCRLALSRFRTITELSLDVAEFRTWTELARTVCLFPSLKLLCLRIICVKKGAVESLADKFYAKSLQIKTLQLEDYETHSPHLYLLTAPRLSTTLTNLTLDTSDIALLEALCSPARSTLACLTSLLSLSITLMLSDAETPGPGIPFVAFLSQIPSTTIRELQLMMDLHDWPQRLFGWHVEPTTRSLDLLDDFLQTLEWSSLEKVRIFIVHIDVDDVLYLRSVDPLPFPQLRSRGILDFAVHDSTDGCHSRPVTILSSCSTNVRTTGTPFEEPTPRSILGSGSLYDNVSHWTGTMRKYKKMCVH
ncbi:hypothetical protein CERSUDRAFT_115927 [Gelatoporia subvermispora B]|uniref:Uncharacterized protein n=1 Tax=Ceriporiopsis subvermispora (strain B) TaxID=914234 RepID=M2QV84_CERS8|nr:hypothetical protein CERSUDRAFT_115927 [Gelatoporia subvermispora B]